MHTQKKNCEDKYLSKHTKKKGTSELVLLSNGGNKPGSINSCIDKQIVQIQCKMGQVLKHIRTWMNFQNTKQFQEATH